METPIRYPAGTVRALLATDLVTPATRHALAERLQRREHPRASRFFTVGEASTLGAVIDRLIPQDDHGAGTGRVDIAAFIDERLADGKGKGWRYDTLPPDRDAFRGGLAAIERDSLSTHGVSFAALAIEHQDDLLAAVQRGDAARFFEELLAECAEIYYADPIVQETIGFVGMADAQGFHALGPDRLEPHEPRALD